MQVPYRKNTRTRMCSTTTFTNIKISTGKRLRSPSYWISLWLTCANKNSKMTEFENSQRMSRKSIKEKIQKTVTVAAEHHRMHSSSTIRNRNGNVATASSMAAFTSVTLRNFVLRKGGRNQQRKKRLRTTENLKSRNETRMINPIPDRNQKFYADSSCRAIAKTV